MGDHEVKGLPYGCDYAKTNRSHCKDKDCEDAIDLGELRLSARVRSNFKENSLMDVWFHANCFWKRARHDINEASIRGFEHLRWEDQEKIRARIKHKENIGDDIKQPKNARVEYSRSDRGSCMECKQKIPEGSLRVEFKSGYHHPKCLAGQHSYLRLADDMDRFDQLEPEDQETLRNLFMGPNENGVKKEQPSENDEMTLEELKHARNEAADEENRQKLSDLLDRQEALKEQTDLIWEVKDVLDKAIRNNKNFKGAKGRKDAAANLLIHNGGNVYEKGTVDDYLLLLSDIVVFGGFEKCPTCDNSNFYYSPDRRVYQCAGLRPKGSCTYYIRDIKRKPFKTDKATSKTELSKYDGKILLPRGRIFSIAVEKHTEADKMVSVESGPTKKIDPSRKRKPAPEGVAKENGFAVDSYFKQADDFHVYVDDDGTPRQFLLHKTESNGDVKFYLMQLLEADDDAEYRIFRRYGTVLTETTKDIVTDCDSLDDALKLFEKTFSEKTNDSWANRTVDLKPSPKQYRLVEWDTPFMGTYGRTSEETKSGLGEAKKAKKEEDSG